MDDGAGPSAPAAAAAPPAAPPPQSPEARDVDHLLARFLLRGRGGGALDFAAFSATWRELRFSHLLSARPRAEPTRARTLNDG